MAAKDYWWLIRSTAANLAVLFSAFSRRHEVCPFESVSEGGKVTLPYMDPEEEVVTDQSEVLVGRRELAKKWSRRAIGDDDDVVIIKSNLMGYVTRPADTDQPGVTDVLRGEIEYKDNLEVKNNIDAMSVVTGGVTSPDKLLSGRHTYCKLNPPLDGVFSLQDSNNKLPYTRGMSSFVYAHNGTQFYKVVAVIGSVLCTVPEDNSVVIYDTGGFDIKMSDELLGVMPSKNKVFRVGTADQASRYRTFTKFSKTGPIIELGGLSSLADFTPGSTVSLYAELTPGEDFSPAEMPNGVGLAMAKGANFQRTLSIGTFTPTNNYVYGLTAAWDGDLGFAFSTDGLNWPLQGQIIHPYSEDSEFESFQVGTIRSFWEVADETGYFSVPDIDAATSYYNGGEIGYLQTVYYNDLDAALDHYSYGVGTSAVPMSVKPLIVLGKSGRYYWHDRMKAFVDGELNEDNLIYSWVAHDLDGEPVYSATYAGGALVTLDLQNIYKVSTTDGSYICLYQIPPGDGWEHAQYTSSSGLVWGFKCQDYKTNNTCYVSGTLPSTVLSEQAVFVPTPFEATTGSAVPSEYVPSDLGGGIPLEEYVQYSDHTIKLYPQVVFSEKSASSTDYHSLGTYRTEENLWSRECDNSTSGNGIQSVSSSSGFTSYIFVNSSSPWDGPNHFDDEDAYSCTTERKQGTTKYITVMPPGMFNKDMDHYLLGLELKIWALTDSDASSNSNLLSLDTGARAGSPSASITANLSVLGVSVSASASSALEGIESSPGGGRIRNYQHVNTVTRKLAKLVPAGYIPGQTTIEWSIGASPSTSATFSIPGHSVDDPSTPGANSVFLEYDVSSYAAVLVQNVSLENVRVGDVNVGSYTVSSYEVVRSFGFDDPVADSRYTYYNDYRSEELANFAKYQSNKRVDLLIGSTIEPIRHLIVRPSSSSGTLAPAPARLSVPGIGLAVLDKESTLKASYNGKWGRLPITTVLMVGESYPVIHPGGVITEASNRVESVGTVSPGGPSGYTYSANKPGWDFITAIDDFNGIPFTTAVLCLSDTILGGGVAPRPNVVWSDGVEPAVAGGSTSQTSGVGSSSVDFVHRGVQFCPDPDFGEAISVNNSTYIPIAPSVNNTSIAATTDTLAVHRYRVRNNTENVILTTFRVSRPSVLYSGGEITVTMTLPLEFRAHVIQQVELGGSTVWVRRALASQFFVYSPDYKTATLDLTKRMYDVTAGVPTEVMVEDYVTTNLVSVSGSFTVAAIP